jgi:hypothetical protein
VTITIPAPSPKSTVRRAALMLLMRCAHVVPCTAADNSTWMSSLVRRVSCVVDDN